MISANEKRVAKNTLFLYARMLLVMLVSIYTSRVILQTLGASDYGIYNVVAGIVTMMSFLNGALSVASTRFITFALGKNDKEEQNRTFSASLNIHLTVSIVIFFIAEIVGLWFLYNKLVIPPDRFDAAFWVLQFSIITTCITFTQVPYRASLIAHENMAIYAYIGLYEAFSKLAIAYLIYVSPIDRLIFYSALILLNTIIVQIVYRYYTYRKYDECRFRLFYDKKLYKKLVSYGGWDLFGGVAVACQGQGINILLNMFFGPVVNAARAIAFQIQSAVAVFVDNFLMAVRPQVVKACAEENYEQMYKLTFKAAKLSYMLMFALMCPICFEINTILHLWLGENVPDYTAVFTVFVLITYMLMSIDTSCMMAFHAIGKIAFGNVVGGTMMISALPISYILLRNGCPPYTVFIVIFCINMLMQVLDWNIVHYHVPFKWQTLFKDVILPCIYVTIIGCVVPALLTVYLDEGVPRLILVVILTEIVNIVSYWHIALTEEERAAIGDFIRKKINHTR